MLMCYCICGNLLTLLNGCRLIGQKTHGKYPFNFVKNLRCQSEFLKMEGVITKGAFTWNLLDIYHIYF
jgi:hypothetical protein